MTFYSGSNIKARNENPKPGTEPYDILPRRIVQVLELFPYLQTLIVSEVRRPFRVGQVSNSLEVLAKLHDWSVCVTLVLNAMGL